MDVRRLRAAVERPDEREPGTGPSHTEVMQRIGVDAVSVDRIALAVKRSGRGFLNKVYTPAELAYTGTNSERLAGRWAAKEAVIKCFDGTGICFPRRRIEVLPGPAGAPRVRLLGDHRGARVEVSITHHSGLAVATSHLEMPDIADILLPAPEAVILPDRPRDAHKGTFGTVVVLAGSLGFTGAAYLAGTGAARAGAGLVRLLVAETIYPILAAKCTEVMATPVPEVAPGAVGHAAYDSVLRQLATAEVGVIGPGLGRDRSTWRLILDLALHAECPLVLDADALNALADSARKKSRLSKNRILTPHPGEMARLLGKTTEAIQADRAGAARRAAKEWGAIIVLKGAHTLVAHPDGRLSEDPHEVPALATGGTGDVLSGVIAALIAQGSDPYAAAVSGVYVHAAAGRRISQRLGDNGYGHGAVPVARAALGGGATWLAVATLEEARELTGLVHVERILVMGGLVPDQAPAAAASGFSIGVSSLDFARALGDTDEVVPVHLKIDTGMGRFGSAPHEATSLARFINDSPGLRLAATWTHFASAGTDEAMTRLQFDRFLAAVSTLGVEPGLRHACNSAAAYRFPEMALDAVRAGIALYGCDWPGASPALALRSVVTHVKTLPTGGTVGYGATWTARNETRVATVAIGYADGVMRARANRGHVLVRGRSAALIGAVSMDAITVDVTGVPGVEVGDVVTLIGPDGDERITAEEVAEWSGTIPYEVLTAIGPRVKRRYKE